MLAAVVEALACPACRAPCREESGLLRCENGHAYDIARQGYVTLRSSAGPRHTGDDAAMVAARHELLGSDVYGGLAARLCVVAAQALAATATLRPRPGLVVDSGGGTGYYLASVLDALSASPAATGHAPGTSTSTSTSTGAARLMPDGSAAAAVPLAGLVLDASPYALRRAAAAHPWIAAVGCDLWQQWPLQDGVAALILCVFAPRNGAEARRVLAPGGSLVVVTPGAGHLRELVSSLGLLGVDEHKDDRLGRSLGPHLVRHSSEPYEETLRLRRRDVAAVVGMGPSARHLDADALAAAISRLQDEIDVTLSVVLTRWRLR